MKRLRGDFLKDFLDHMILLNAQPSFAKTSMTSWKKQKKFQKLHLKHIFHNCIHTKRHRSSPVEGLKPLLGNFISTLFPLLYQLLQSKVLNQKRNHNIHYSLDLIETKLAYFLTLRPKKWTALLKVNSEIVWTQSTIFCVENTKYINTKFQM